VPFVQEAYNLLSQSIIHVEKDDVDIDSDSDDDDNDEGGGNGEDDDDNANAGAPSPARARTATATPAPAGQQEPPKKPKVSITYDRYMQMMQRIVYMVAEHESAQGAGMPRSEVVQAYLDGVEEQLGTIEQLEHETQLVEKVLNKLVKERYLLELRGSAAQAAEGAEIDEDGADEDEPVLTVHPECEIA